MCKVYACKATKDGNRYVFDTQKSGQYVMNCYLYRKQVQETRKVEVIVVIVFKHHGRDCVISCIFWL